MKYINQVNFLLMAAGILFAGYVLMQTFLTDDPPLPIAPVAQTSVSGDALDSGSETLPATRPGVVPPAGLNPTQRPDTERRRPSQMAPNPRQTTPQGAPIRRGSGLGQSGTGIASSPNAQVPGSTSPQGSDREDGLRPAPQRPPRSFQGSGPQRDRPAPLVDRSSAKRGSSDGSPPPPPPRGSMNQ